MGKLVKTFQGLPVLRAFVQRDTVTVITESCPFCFGSHVHAKPFSTSTYAFRLARCRKYGLKCTADNGLVMDNTDGYYIKVEYK